MTVSLPAGLVTWQFEPLVAAGRTARPADLAGCNAYLASLEMPGRVEV